MRTIHLRAGPTPDTYVVVFAYDEQLLSLVKTVPGRAYDPVRRVWRIPAAPEVVEMLRMQLPPDTTLTADPAVLEAHANAVGQLRRAADVKKAGDSDISYTYLTEPYAHQRAGLEFLASLGGGALLWEMGTGKTKTAIDFCEWLAAEHVLVICPNTVKRNWGAEVEKHAGHQGYDVLDGSVKDRIGRLAKTRYSIVNCESLSIAAFAKAAQAVEWDVVIVDESTRFKTPSAARTKALHKLTATHRLILTGTPITGKPEDAWAQLHFVAPGLLGSYWHFRDRYIALDFFKHPIGLKAGMAPELNKLIASRSYRVLKEDVLDLPPKVYEDRVVELAGPQKQAYEQMKHDLYVELAGMENATAYNILTMLLRLTQITAGLVGGGDRYTWLPNNAKVDELDQLLTDELRDQQVVVFGMYQEELRQLSDRYSAPIIYGPTPERERFAHIEDFQSGRTRVLLCQERTGGIGINLTAAQTAIYYTRGWSLEEYLQSQDRLHRIGQTRSVTILHLIAKGTVDEDIAKALRKKQNLADQLTGDDARRLARDLLGRKL